MELGTVVGAGELVAIGLSQNSLYILVGRHLQANSAGTGKIRLLKLKIQLHELGNTKNGPKQHKELFFARRGKMPKKRPKLSAGARSWPA